MFPHRNLVISSNPTYYTRQQIVSKYKHHKTLSGKTGEKYSFNKKSDNQRQGPKFPEATVKKYRNHNKNGNYPTSQEPISN